VSGKAEWSFFICLVLVVGGMTAGMHGFPIVGILCAIGALCSFVVANFQKDEA
jgi:uncharacterized membrane protein required for colicin V production